MMITIQEENEIEKIRKWKRLEAIQLINVTSLVNPIPCHEMNKNILYFHMTFLLTRTLSVNSSNERCHNSHQKFIICLKTSGPKFSSTKDDCSKLRAIATTRTTLLQLIAI